VLVRRGHQDRDGATHNLEQAQAENFARFILSQLDSRSSPSMDSDLKTRHEAERPQRP
jgi:hypothetical protein